MTDETCNCGQNVFMYTNVSTGVIHKKCAKTIKTAKKKKNKNWEWTDAKSKPCDYDIKIQAYPVPKVPVVVGLDKLSLKSDFEKNFEMKFLNNTYLDRNYMIYYMNKHKALLSPNLLKKGEEQIKKIDEKLKGIFNGYVAAMEFKPSMLHISEIIHFLEKYTKVPKFYINENILRNYSFEDLKRFYFYIVDWKNKFYKEGFVYVKRNFAIEVTHQKPKPKSKPKIPSPKTKKFKMPTLKITKEKNLNDDYFTDSEESDNDDDNEENNDSEYSSSSEEEDGSGDEIIDGYKGFSDEDSDNDDVNNMEEDDYFTNSENESEEED